MRYKVVKCPSRQMALDADQNNIIYLKNNSNCTSTMYNNYIIVLNEKVPYGCVALSAKQRTDNIWNMSIYIDDKCDIVNYKDFHLVIHLIYLFDYYY